ncbi:DUF488 domain-containing protein [Natrarchaeobaculum aegyptiacum]|uniref:DUF488 domain-containing protein n=1 Tax=Natrarchaeobaculum aegyptiacum TaxID=745377 RepID=A0A2Z2HR44_9EURY|nr:DUF488 domain-containing protein [Natrarchaeobaculum aegyptiacum]ARS88505.1 hypothetical protein B1756_01210 [Natrarchaeobaculum aegyptiacum]
MSTDAGRGQLADTYVAALQHDLVDLPPETTLVGVVRSPTPWFHATVDENLPALGPPANLLESTKAAEEDLKVQGLCAEGAHNAAWDRVDFGERYREHLETDEEARTALESLATRLESGESLALVCFENTETKRCHRTILRERLEQERA